MTISFITGSDAQTIFIEDGKQVSLCRCGQIHEGDYALEDWMKHQCLHNCALLWLANRAVMCPQCGASWYIKGEPLAGGGMVAIDYGLDELDDTV